MRIALIIGCCVALNIAEAAKAGPRGLDIAISGTHSVIRGDIVTVQANSKNTEFQNWVTGFRAVALRRGISSATCDQAFANVKYDADIVHKDRNQFEFTQTIWDYLDAAVSDNRIQNGAVALKDNLGVLEKIEEAYSVDKEIVTAIWGMESSFGANRGHIPVIDALATLAFDGRRRAFFETQLIAALKILQSGDVRLGNMTGSWAGAMGHTQFIPTSFLSYAVDGTGNGKRDIWSDDPADALASTAAYLAHYGWRKGQPWGIEVQLPEGFDYSQTGVRTKKDVADWMARGVRDISGNEIQDYGKASVLLPAGSRGAPFIIFHNFHVLERYNQADAYVIGVGHLADRLKGGPAIQASWPREDRALKYAERNELQKLLTAAGFDTDGIDGIIGPNTIAAVRKYQASVGMVPDGHPNLEVLKRLR